MFKIYDGRKHFFQWDTGQKLIVNDETITEVHFCNKTDDCALVCEVYSANGLRLVNVPNILFQSDWRIKVWGYCEDHTKHEETFKVASRTKPADYIYTETEVKTYEALEAKLNALTGGVEFPTKISQFENDAGYITLEDIPEAEKEMPEVTEEDNGKFLRVVNGAWAASVVLNAEGVSF